MTRPWHGGVGKVALPALIVGLAISYSGFASAGATRTEVQGHALQVEFVGIADDFYDGAGGEHLRHLVLRWHDFSLHGEGISIQGKLTLDGNANVDQEGTGPMAGTFVAVEGGQVIWNGHFSGHLVKWMARATLRGHGKGQFAGNRLELEMVEIENPNPFVDDFTLNGWILDLGS